MGEVEEWEKGVSEKLSAVGKIEAGGGEMRE